MRNRKQFLATLETDDTARADFVTALIAASAILNGTAPDVPEHTKVTVGLKMAARLSDAAQRLCDHARINGDGRCRYCSALTDVEPT